jgi:hypothetical protein
VSFPPDYPIYHEIGEEPGDWVLLEVPVSPVSGYLWLGDAPDLQFYAPVHRKRLVNGTLSRVPWRELLYFEQESPALGALTGGHEMDLLAAPRELGQLIDDWPIGYVIVHQSRMPDAEYARDIVAMLNLHESLCFYRAEQDLLIYRAHWHPDGCPPRTPPPTEGETDSYTLDLGTPGDTPYLGWYWYWREDVGGTPARWAGENDASSLRVEVPPGAAYVMTLTATSFSDDQEVTVTVNGAQVGRFDVPASGWHERSVSLPADVVGDGDLHIVLSHSRARTADGRSLTAAYSRVTFREAE